MSLAEQFLSNIPGSPLLQLRNLDQRYALLRQDTSSPPQVIHLSSETLGELDADVVICGGTLGILLAASLQQKGQKVILLERGTLRGRQQEWNVSRAELNVLLELDLLTTEELETAIVTEYNPARISFFQGHELFVKDILNIGVYPLDLLEKLKEKFLLFGGKILENTPFISALILSDGIKIIAGDYQLKSRLLVDAMGHFSPIVKQARRGTKPTGICLVVGTCAQGYPNNQTGDLLVTNTPILNQCQYFWEAFPAQDGRTTYLFTYVDAEPERFSLEFLTEEYLRLLPDYQQIDLDALNFQRFLCGFFPSYQNSPLQMPYSRILAVGDSAASQSPVSFGGFGAMLRHLQRLSNGIDEALKTDHLTQKDLALLQPYQPNLSVTWLFQKTMSVGLNQTVDPNQINHLMSTVFLSMEQLGEDVLKPFLQDVIGFSALTKILTAVPLQSVLPIVPQIGLLPLLDWLRHYLSLGLYNQLYLLGKNIETKPPFVEQYYWHRLLESWQYGSGSDYHQALGEK